MIELRHVTKRYGAVEALHDVSFRAPEGQIVGLLGQNGAGKSTTLNILTGYLPPTSGQVLVDGMDVRDIRKDELRRRIGVVPQKAMLFKGTIRSNLLWGNADATEADLRDALKVAQALDVAASASA